MIRAMTDVARQKLFNVSLLHGRLFRTSHVSLIVSIASVVVVFEQVQSELRHSTTEILSLARKSLAGGCGREEDNEEERKEEDGDTKKMRLKKWTREAGGEKQTTLMRPMEVCGLVQQRC
ncbi:hypothetical protein GQ600_9530 [Phytophthora cactorum]|nr:hypothetical protein GQ600_9530 [Phytophthora cactorum]